MEQEIDVKPKELSASAAEETWQKSDHRKVPPQKKTKVMHGPGTWHDRNTGASNHQSIQSPTRWLLHTCLTMLEEKALDGREGQCPSMEDICQMQGFKTGKSPNKNWRNAY